MKEILNKYKFHLLWIVFAAGFLLNFPKVFYLDNFGGDFKPLYTATHLLQEGKSIYNDPGLIEKWKTFGIEGKLPGLPHTPNLYPPLAIFLFSPLSLLPWPAANLVFFILNLSGFCLTIFLIYKVSGHDKIRFFLLLLLFGFSLKSTYLGLNNNNPTFLSFFLGMLAVYRTRSSPDQFMVSGSILALALFKPQIGIIFLAWHLITKNYKAVFLACGIFLLINTAYFIALPSEISEYSNILKVIHLPGNNNDFSTMNPEFYILVNIHGLIHLIVNDRELSSFLAIALPGSLVLLYFYRQRKTLAVNDLRNLPVLAIAVLLASYHRMYDPVLLVLLFLAHKDITAAFNLRRLIFMIPLFVPLTGFLLHTNLPIPPDINNFLLLNATISCFLLLTDLALERKAPESEPV